MRFDIITIFPEIFNSYFQESILKRAQKEKLIEIMIHNLRDFSDDKKHHQVDDRPFGGGPGMVLQIGPIYRAVTKLASSNRKLKNLKTDKLKTRTILLSAKGKKFDQRMAQRLSCYNQVIFICGRYEGVDERVARYVADEEISIGDFLLSGGELAASIIIEAVARLVPGVLGNKESIGSRPYPVYTRPEIFQPRRLKNSWKVPKVLLSGDHRKIEEWRGRHL